MNVVDELIFIFAGSRTAFCYF